MASASDIANYLSGKTYTLGWDVVLACRQTEINEFLFQQHLNKPDLIPVVNWDTTDGLLSFKDLTFSAPHISFADSHITDADAKVTVTFDITDGNIAELNSFGQITRLTRIIPDQGLHLSCNAKLITEKVDGENSASVVIDFKTSTINTIDVVNQPSAEVLDYFQNWLSEIKNSFNIFTLNLESKSEHLVPQAFHIRSQPASDATENGAVLLFIKTNDSLGDEVSFPDDNYPWIIPDENSTAVLLSNKLVLTSYIKPMMDALLTQGSWQLHPGVKDGDSCFLLASDDAEIKQGVLRTDSTNEQGHAWSGIFDQSPPSHVPNLEIEEDYIFNLNGAVLKYEDGLMMLNFDQSDTQTFGADFIDCYKGKLEGVIHNKIKGVIRYEISIDKARGLLSYISTDNNITAKSDFSSVFGGYSASQKTGDTVCSAMVKMLNCCLCSIDSLECNDIMNFFQNYVVLSGDYLNVNTQAINSGDMLIFGDISLPEEMLTMSPKNGRVVVNETLKFSVPNGQRVTYRADIGSITSDGVYTAPKTIDSRRQKATITAISETGTWATANVTIFNSSVMITPEFITMNEKDLSAFSFSTCCIGDKNEIIDWSVKSDESGVTGTIDKQGIFTPAPAGNYPLGYTFIMVEAIANDGCRGQGIILISSKDTFPEFSVTPGYIDMQPDVSAQLFSAQADLDFSPDNWNLYPHDAGTLSPVNNDKDTYSVTYTVPETPAKDLAIVHTYASGHPHRAGYGLIDFADKPAVTTWSRVKDISVLSVANEVGGGRAQLYQNNRQQAVVNIHFLGTDEDGKAVAVSIDEILPHINLVDYETGSLIPRDAGDEWYYTVEPRSYGRCPVVQNLSHVTGSLDAHDDEPTSNIFTFYVSCNNKAISEAKSIAVQVILEDGSIKSTAKDGDSDLDSSVFVDVLESVDYSSPQNYKLSMPDPVVVNKDLPWATVYRDNSGVSYSDRDDKCHLTLSQYSIQSTVEGISGFPEVSAENKNIYDWDITRRFYCWKDLDAQTIFSCLDNMGVPPAVVIARSESTTKDGSINIWFIGSAAHLVKGQVYLYDGGDGDDDEDDQNHTLYRIEIPDYQAPDVSSDEAYLTLLKISTPSPMSLKPYKFIDNNQVVKLNLVDRYGNSGSFNVSWDENEHYDKPYLTV